MPKALSVSQEETPSTREPFVTLAEAAQHFALSKRTLERRIASNPAIPVYHLGTGPKAPVRVRLSEVEEALLIPA